MDKKITFWDIYKVALRLSDYDEWRNICRSALYQGITSEKIGIALDLAYFTIIFMVLFAISLLGIIFYCIGN